MEDLRQARALPVDALLRAQGDPRVLAEVAAAADGYGVFCPVEDDASEVRERHAAPACVDLLAGWNRDEMRAFPSVKAPAQEEVERRFAAPAREWACHASRAGRQAWLYRFDGLDCLPLGACHCAELPFVFDTHAAFRSAPMLQGVDPTAARSLTDLVQHAWLEFIHGRSPGWDPAPQVHAFA